MALDVYTWMVQRLHRVNAEKPPFVPWVSLWEQFGQGYERIRDFRWTLGQVKVVYDRARYSLDGGGVWPVQQPAACLR